MHNLKNAVEELSRTNDDIEQLNPNELDSIAAALSARSRVVIQIHRIVADGHADASDDTLDRLQNEYRRGAGIIRRLKLVQARLRAEYEQNRGQRALMEGLPSNSSGCRNRLNILG